jgi:hypothetical protein
MTSRTCIICNKTKDLEKGFWRCNHQYEKPRYRLTCRQCMSDAKPKKPRVRPTKPLVTIDAKVFTQLLKNRRDEPCDI